MTLQAWPSTEHRLHHCQIERHRHHHVAGGHAARLRIGQGQVQRGLAATGPGAGGGLPR